MTSLKFHGGVDEIGGNKILLHDGDTSIWLDFGKSFTLGQDYYTGWLQPRTKRGLLDLFEFDLVPRIEGLYAEDQLEGTDLRYEEPRYDGVFISHAHADHVNHIAFIDPTVPVYTGTGTKLFMEAQERTSTFTNYGEHDFRRFRTGDHIKVGDLELEPIHVDHSIPGAYGYIIHTSKGAVVYTGDVRAHGPRNDMTEEFLKVAVDSKPIAMISEGTRMARTENGRNLSETQVLQGVMDVCRQADSEGKAVLYTHGPRDMDRLRTFYTAARSCGRTFVIGTRTAHLLHRLIEDEHLDLPDPLKDDNVRVYYRRKKSGEYREKDYYIWERRYMDKIVATEELSARPDRYIVNMEFNSLTELIDIRPERGGHFIYSKSEPFAEDDVEDAVMHNWLRHFGLRYHQLHASGHMSAEELREMIASIRPGKLFPVHTEGAKLFEEHLEQTITPVIGETYQL